jgi:hypothetical protein
VSFLWSASRSGTERGKRHSARDVSEAGVWLRYDFNGKVESILYSAKLLLLVDNMMRLVMALCIFGKFRFCKFVVSCSGNVEIVTAVLAMKRM